MIETTRICPTCGNTYTKKQNTSLKSWIERYKVCSRKCKRHSPEAIEKMRQSAIGLQAKENHWNWNPQSKRRSEETTTCKCGCGTKIKKYDYRGREKTYVVGHATIGKKKVFPESWYANMKAACSTPEKRAKCSKENRWNWQGGITPANHKIRTSLEYKEWRMKVYQRDRFSCINCGYRSCKKKDIVADHIKLFFLFPELRLDVDNGRTLCRDCDKILGYNHNRDFKNYK